MKASRSFAALTSSTLSGTKTSQRIKEVVTMYRTQRISQRAPARGQRRIALTLVAALAFSAAVALGAFAIRAYSLRATMRAAALPAGASPVGNNRTAQVVGPEDIAALPSQIQAQVRRALGSSTGKAHAAPGAQVFGPEDIATLPPQIQDQVRGMRQASAARNAGAHEPALSPEDILTLPPQIQAQVRYAHR